MTTRPHQSVRKESNREPIFSWISHHLRLLGQVSAAQAAKTFGVNTRQFRRWIEEYNVQAALKGNPEAISLRGPRDAPAFRASGFTSEELEGSGKQARGARDVFPVASGLAPSTSEALALLDAWRAHAILAQVSPDVYEDPTFLDGNGDPIVVETGGAIHPRLDGEIIPALLQALTMKRSVALDYINKKGHRTIPKNKSVVISPDGMLDDEWSTIGDSSKLSSDVLEKMRFRDKTPLYRPPHLRPENRNQGSKNHRLQCLYTQSSGHVRGAGCTIDFSN